MTNREAIQRFDGQVHSTFINKLFWIAGSFENSDLKDFLEEMQEEDWENCLPEIRKSKYFKSYQKNNDFIQALIDHKKFGLIAELHHPRCHNFNYDEKGKVRGCQVSSGNCRISYVYGENQEELMSAIEKSAEKIYNEYVAEDKKKNSLKLIKKSK